VSGAVGAEVPGLDQVLSAEGWVYASARAVDPDDPGRFHALFGRDALITALQLLPARPDVARATLRALAATQGVRDEPVFDEEPGKVVHEQWPDGRGTNVETLGLPVHGEVRYYGSADGTSWFLVLLAALDEPELTAELEEAWRAAGGWLARALERGGGLVRWGPRRALGGLLQQGWRDAVDPLAPEGAGGGILKPDLTVPEPPVADADCQAAALAALRALAHLSGDEAWSDRAAALRARVSAAFDPETMALEAGDRPVAGAGSQLGWLLWADALEEDAARRAAERLAAPDVLSPWGLRTLAEGHPAYGPHHYHRGAIWPFDSWLGWGGLRAAGHADAAECVRAGVLEALDRLGAFPELYAAGAGGPERIATANQVQAWTVGARWALEHEWDGRAPALLRRAA
jgi:glycogen debranching enzyme